MRLIFAALLLVALVPARLYAEAIGGGKGGPFIQHNSADLSRFDGDISGTPMIIGGYGFGWATKTFRIGGGGGGGFLWSGSETTQFGMGYGGVVGEYLISEWLFARLLIGGGGYSVSKVLVQTDTLLQVQKISSGGFILFHPQIVADIKLSPFSSLGFSLGYFAPNIAKLNSFSVSIQLMVGRI